MYKPGYAAPVIVYDLMIGFFLAGAANRKRKRQMAHRRLISRRYVKGR